MSALDTAVRGCKSCWFFADHHYTDRWCRKTGRYPDPAVIDADKAPAWCPLMPENGGPVVVALHESARLIRDEHGNEVKS